MYTHSKSEVMIAKDASLASAADVGDWAPGMVPHIIRAIALVFTIVPQATGVLKIDKRVTAGSDTGRGDGDIATINYTTAMVGLVVYVDGLDIEIKPGEEIVAQVTDATPTSGSAHIIAYVEPRWETPANNADMAASA